MASQTEIIFEPFRLDPINERLLRDGKKVHLTPKAFSVLRYLAEHSDQLITKEILLKSLWPNIAVTDAVLTVCIGEIRKALEDSSKKPKFIETVHRRGYRFLAHVRNGVQSSAATSKQDIRFCTTADGIRIAYSMMGQGAPLVIPPQLVTHLEADLVEGPLADVYEALARHHTVVRFDMRGTGLSDRDVPLSSEQQFVIDLEAVVDHLGLERFPLYGLSGGGRLALRYYAKHPNRVSQLVFYGTDVAPVGGERKRLRDITIAVMRASWQVGSKMMVEQLMPLGGSREDVERLTRWFRVSVSSEVAERLMDLREKRDDLAPILANVSVPALVIHRRGDHVPFSGGRELAARIPGARFLALEGYNHLPATHDEAMELVTPVIEFLAKDRDALEARPVSVGLPVVFLFASIEASAPLAQRLGAKRLQRLIGGHEDMIRRAIESYKGSEVKPAGGGIAASFYSASRALGCAMQIHQAVVKRNAVNPDDAVKLGIGLNARDTIAGNDGDSFAISTQQVQQIAAWAEPGHVLVSDEVRQLASGKGFTFQPVAIKAVNGFKNPVALFELRGK